MKENDKLYESQEEFYQRFQIFIENANLVRKYYFENQNSEDMHNLKLN
jgi:hypothetical protein